MSQSNQREIEGTHILKDQKVFTGFYIDRQQTLTIFKVEGGSCSASSKTMSGITATHILLHARLINKLKWYK